MQVEEQKHDTRNSKIHASSLENLECFFNKKLQKDNNIWCLKNGVEKKNVYTRDDFYRIPIKLRSDIFTKGPYKPAEILKLLKTNKKTDKNFIIDFERLPNKNFILINKFTFVEDRDKIIHNIYLVNSKTLFLNDLDEGIDFINMNKIDLLNKNEKIDIDESININIKEQINFNNFEFPDFNELSNLGNLEKFKENYLQIFNESEEPNKQINCKFSPEKINLQNHYSNININITDNNNLNSDCLFDYLKNQKNEILAEKKSINKTPFKLEWLKKDFYYAFDKEYFYFLSNIIF